MSTERYLRQEFLNNICPDAQKLLENKRILVLGAGGLGSPVLYYLAAAGIGTLTIVDRDIVTESNLNRQILYPYDTIGRPKSEVSAQRIKEFNPEVTVQYHIDEITEQLLNVLLPQHDLVFDCCDNHETRMIIAKSCNRLGLPCIVTGINKLEGFTFLSIPERTACYGCLYGSNSPKRGSVPQVLGANAGVFGSLAANNGILFLLGHQELNKITIFDLFTFSFEKVAIHKNPNCPICSIKKEITRY